MKNNLGCIFFRFSPSFVREILVSKSGVGVVAGNTAWLMLDRITRMLLGITVGAWVARYLGPSQYGELAYSIAMVALFQTIANLGADGIIVRNLVHNTKDTHVILGTALGLRVVFGIISYFLVIVSVVFLQPGNKEALVITAIVGGILVFQAADTIDLWFQSQNQNKRTVIPKLVAYFFTNGIKVTLILNDASLLYFAIALLLDIVVASFGLWFSYRRFPADDRWLFRFSYSKNLLKESFPYLISGVAIMIYMRIDQIIIREYLGAKELGLYSAALVLSTFWGFIPMTLYTALGPYVANKKLESEQAYYDALSNIFRIFGGIAIAAVLFTMFLGPLIVELLFGESYLGSINILLVHVFTNIFIFLGIAQGLWIINEKLGRISIYKTLIGLIVCLVGNFSLVPIYGAIGSAITAVLVQFSSAVASNVLFSTRILKMQLFGIFPFDILFRKKPKS